VAKISLSGGVPLSGMRNNTSKTIVFTVNANGFGAKPVRRPNFLNIRFVVLIGST
jgi:hypothetical protein